ncbi:septum formation family protein [Leifsonia shinshuensis]|uniref:septum formation family protein n=1 Tax=Leifsonia shinshuensis TaxID=150026 RepID=UPI0028607A63|nr:septum formation family protein [Leifsonia shinshuensis]MDR6972235.1 hypothetical protein [Leifsonia shinshuensis]
MRLDRRRERIPHAGGRTVEGMSRRGWMLLVAATVAVGGVLVSVGLAAVGFPSAGTSSAASSEPQPVSRHTLEPLPGPRGLPPRPTSTHVATVPAQALDTLTAGDCLQTYDSKEAPAYPVVDCSAPHLAQLLWKGTLSQPAVAPFPGTDALDAQVSDLCEQHLDWHWVAVWNEDVQVDLRYPGTAAQWSTGARSYYCFVYTFSRHELTGSALAGG